MNKTNLTRRRLFALATTLAIAPPALAAQRTKKMITPTTHPSPVTLQHLTCEYRADPLGLDTLAPRLGWQLVDPAGTRGQRQTAYRVRVATRRALLESHPDLWDSGRVASDHSVAVEYAGHPLRSGDDAYWQVMVWDRDGAPSAWSAPARFTIGPLTPADWNAQWIGMASAPGNECPHFRHSFTLATLPETALAYIGSIGYHELYVNGHRVGDGVLAPSVSDLRKRALYVTYDICKHLRPGENVVALWAAPGWAQFKGVNPPVEFGVAKSPLCIARLQFGTPRHPHATAPIVTDTSWRCALSGTTHLGQWKNHDFGGDHVDTAKEISRWNDIGLDTAHWETATAYTPGLALSPDPVEPNRRCQTIPVKRIEPLGAGRYRVEMAEIFTGWLTLTASAAPGTKITVKTTSLPNTEVECNQVNEYIVGPTGTGTFCERFSYHQYHYVTIEGLETAPTPDQITGYRIGNDLRPTGAFQSSNALLNSIYDATIRTYVNLTTGGMTVDCPHRERLGYGGDGHTSMELALDHFDTNAYLNKWAQDFCDVQDNKGEIYHTAPTMDGGGGPAWSGFVITLPYEVYISTGDLQILHQTYPVVRRWLAYLKSHIGPDDLLAPLPGPLAYPSDGNWYFLGDWAAPHRIEGSHSPAASLFNNCYYVYVLGLAAQSADRIGKSAEAAEYRALAESLRAAINRRFYNPDTHTYLDTRQTHCILPLIAGVVPADRIAYLSHVFENELLVTQTGHLDTGLHGTYFMTKYLTEHDRSDLVFTYATQTTFPSYGELLAKGYTTWPEYWGDADSKTHGCLNGIGGWFQRGLAGIRPDPAAPGYRHTLIKPAFVGDLTHVEAHHDGPYGRIAVRWERDSNNHVTIDITIPPNSTAEIHLPNPTNIPAVSTHDITILPTAPGQTAYRIAAGKYRFETKI